MSVFVIDGNWPNYIGNDGQSAKGARQGFLDYILTEQEAQAQAAEDQFKEAVNALLGADSIVLGGEPAGIIVTLTVPMIRRCWSPANVYFG